MVQKELYNVRDPPQEGGVGGATTGGKRETHIPLRALFNQARWKLTSSDGEFVSSDHASIQFCFPSSYSIISNIHINRCQTH